MENNKTKVPIIENNLRLGQAQSSYETRIDDLLDNNKSFRAFYDTVKYEGDNYVSHKVRNESKVYDDRFIIELEKGFDAIDNIIANPRSFIKEDPTLVRAELAKKINYKSVQHLSSHTQFIHHIDERGDVIPDKILTIITEEDLNIYENRFLMTLIDRSMRFINTRYDYIVSHMDTRDSELLLVHSNVVIDGITYEVDSRVKISKPSKDSGNEEFNNQLLLRLKELKRRSNFYFNSDFMKRMRGFKRVNNPIHKTNIIVKNPDYHKCYLLWCFLDEYDEMGVHYNIEEADKIFDDNYYKNLQAMMASNMLVLNSNVIKGVELQETRKTRELNPKINLSLEDETYDDGKFFYERFPVAREESIHPMPLPPEKARELRLAHLNELKKEEIEHSIISFNIEKDKVKVAKAEAIQEAEENKANNLKEQELAQIKDERAKRKEEERLQKLDVIKKSNIKKKKLEEEELFTLALDEVTKAALEDKKSELKLFDSNKFIDNDLDTKDFDYLSTNTLLDNNEIPLVFDKKVDFQGDLDKKDVEK